MMNQCAVKLLLSWVCVGLLLEQWTHIEASAPMYQYQRFPFRKKQKNERKIKNLKLGCEPGCVEEIGLAQTECVRKCMSESCFNDLYSKDPIEDGEIDVRYTSFKGCILQRMP